jgi:hypothetical protein
MGDRKAAEYASAAVNISLHLELNSYYDNRISAKGAMHWSGRDDIEMNA